MQLFTNTAGNHIDLIDVYITRVRNNLFSLFLNERYTFRAVS